MTTKKVKDLTFKEMNSICMKYYHPDYNSCNTKCPFKLEGKGCKLYCADPMLNKKYSEEEVEVED